MTNETGVIRFPHAAGLLRGANMQKVLCSVCLEDKTHGFKIFNPEIMKQSIFICDSCLKEIKKKHN